MIQASRIFRLMKQAIKSLVLVVITLTLVSNNSFAQNQSIRVAQTRVAKVFGTGGLSRLESWQTATAMSDDGLFVTAWSYVLDSRATVVLDDGRRFTAELIGHHPQMELALLKIDVTEQPHFELNQNRMTEVGEPVFALSNVYGVATGSESVSVQRGVIAAQANVRTQRGARTFGYAGPALIVDAIVNNPGAAGGAITDLKGELLGVIGRESQNASSGLWMNFAVPTEQVAMAVEEMLSGKAMQSTAARSMPAEPMSPELLGLRMVPDVVTSTPPWVEQVVAGGAAWKAGLRSDDLVVSVNQVPTASLAHFLEQLAGVDRDVKMSIMVQREEGFLTFQVEVR